MGGLNGSLVDKAEVLTEDAALDTATVVDLASDLTRLVWLKASSNWSTYGENFICEFYLYFFKNVPVFLSSGMERLRSLLQTWEPMFWSL